MYSFYYVAVSVEKIKLILLYYRLNCGPGHSGKRVISLVHLILDTRPFRAASSLHQKNGWGWGSGADLSKFPCRGSGGRIHSLANTSMYKCLLKSRDLGLLWCVPLTLTFFSLAPFCLKKQALLQMLTLCLPSSCARIPPSQGQAP